MDLLKTYLKIIFIRHRYNYLIIILSIIGTYIAMAVTLVYMDNLLFLSSENMYPYLHYLYISLRTIFAIGGITFIISQYYNIMRSGVRDYCILKALGATRQNIKNLIFLQMIFLIIITVPIGLFTGYLLTGSILELLDSFSLNQNTLDFIDSINTFFIIAGIACCFIISIGIYLERGIRKLPLSSILTDSTIMGEEVFKDGITKEYRLM
jgi:ABC-type antimicrobial peptide transport system permease subunit